jgi:uncharacterized protein
MLKIFWNAQGRRVRAGWRILLHGLCYLALLFAFSSTTSYLFDWFAGSTGITRLVSEQIEASGHVKITPDQPDYTERLERFANGLAGWPLDSIAGVAAAVVALWLAGRFLDRRRLPAFGFHFDRGWWLDLVFGMGLGAVLMAFIFGVELAAGWITIREYFYSAFLPFGVVILFGVLNYLQVGIGEEILSRGYHLRNLAEGLRLGKISPRTSLLLAYGISSLMFGLFHLGNANATWISTLNIAVAGLLLGLGYVLTGELAIPIGVHITWNLFQGMIFGFPVSGNASQNTLIRIEQGGPLLWTGGDFGPEAGLLGLFTMILGMGLTVLWVRWRCGSARLQDRLAVYSAEEQEVI